MDGVLVVNKDKGFTSRDIDNIISKKIGTKKVGHTGTLDPLATGVLVVCIGRATKLVEILVCNEKEYIAEVSLGTLTDTLDITGNVLEKKSCTVDKDNLLEVLNSFKGKYIQTVPKYSALKVNGKKLYEYAREGLDVELPKREVEIKEIELLEYNSDSFKFKCSVSKGTYIRSLIRDICQCLNVIGVMSNLTRTKEGEFNIESSYTIEDIKNDEFTLLSIKDVLDAKTVEITDDTYSSIKNGCSVENIYNCDIILFEGMGLLRLYKKEGNVLKPWKCFS